MNTKLTVLLACCFLFFAFQVQGDDSKDLKNLTDKCRKFDKLSCEIVLPRLNYENPEFSGELSRFVCENKGEFCANAMYYGSTPDQKKLLALRMDQLCAKLQTIVCSDLADYLDEQGEHEAAIKISKKQFLKSKTGRYPYYEYRYGDANKAADAMKSACDADEHECPQYLTRFKTNKATPYLLERTIQNCKNQKYISEGSDGCVTAGLVLSRQGQQSKAIETMMYACQRYNRTACALIIGLPETMGASQAKALRTYCGVYNKEKTGMNTPFIKEPLDCNDVKTDTQTVGAENITKAIENLKEVDLNNQSSF